MFAPVDARGELKIGKVRLALQVNYQTIALAEQRQPDVVVDLTAGSVNVTGLATLVWAFASIAHPDLKIEQAFAAVVRDGKAAGDAVRAVLAKALAVEIDDEGDGTPDPRTPASA